MNVIKSVLVAAIIVVGVQAHLGFVSSFNPVPVVSDASTSRNAIMVPAGKPTSVSDTQSQSRGTAGS